MQDATELKVPSLKDVSLRDGGAWRLPPASRQNRNNDDDDDDDSSGSGPGRSSRNVVACKVKRAWRRLTRSWRVRQGRERRRCWDDVTHREEERHPLLPNIKRQTPGEKNDDAGRNGGGDVSRGAKSCEEDFSLCPLADLRGRVRASGQSHVRVQPRRHDIDDAAAAESHPPDLMLSELAARWRCDKENQSRASRSTGTTSGSRSTRYLRTPVPPTPRSLAALGTAEDVWNCKEEGEEPCSCYSCCSGCCFHQGGAVSERLCRCSGNPPAQALQGNSQAGLRGCWQVRRHTAATRKACWHGRQLLGTICEERQAEAAEKEDQSVEPCRTGCERLKPTVRGDCVGSGSGGGGESREQRRQQWVLRRGRRRCCPGASVGRALTYGEQQRRGGAFVAGTCSAAAVSCSAAGGGGCWKRVRCLKSSSDCGSCWRATDTHCARDRSADSDSSKANATLATEEARRSAPATCPSRGLSTLLAFVRSTSMLFCPPTKAFPKTSSRAGGRRTRSTVCRSFSCHCSCTCDGNSTRSYRGQHCSSYGSQFFSPSSSSSYSAGGIGCSVWLLRMSDVGEGCAHYSGGEVALLGDCELRNLAKADSSSNNTSPSPTSQKTSKSATGSGGLDAMDSLSQHSQSGGGRHGALSDMKRRLRTFITPPRLQLPSVRRLSKGDGGGDGRVLRQSRSVTSSPDVGEHTQRQPGRAVGGGGVSQSCDDVRQLEDIFEPRLAPYTPPLRLSAHPTTSSEAVFRAFTPDLNIEEGERYRLEAHLFEPRDVVCTPPLLLRADDLRPQSTDCVGLDTLRIPDLSPRQKRRSFPGYSFDVARVNRAPLSVTEMREHVQKRRSTAEETSKALLDLNLTDSFDGTSVFDHPISPPGLTDGGDQSAAGGRQGSTGGSGTPASPSSSAAPEHGHEFVRAVHYRRSTEKTISPLAVSQQQQQQQSSGRQAQQHAHNTSTEDVPSKSRTSVDHHGDNTSQGIGLLRSSLRKSGSKAPGGEVHSPQRPSSASPVLTIRHLERIATASRSTSNVSSLAPTPLPPLPVDTVVTTTTCNDSGMSQAGTSAGAGAGAGGGQRLSSQSGDSSSTNSPSSSPSIVTCY